MSPCALIIVGSVFGFREIEISLARRKAVKLDRTKRVLTIHLPVSKTDPMALGCHRSWGCVCTSLANVPCPYCEYIKHEAHLAVHFDEETINDEDFPMFPNLEGRF